jgi:hypothetical protein
MLIEGRPMTYYKSMNKLLDFFDVNFFLKTH